MPRGICIRCWKPHYARYSDKEIQHASERFYVPDGGTAYLGFTAELNCFSGVIQTAEDCASDDAGIARVRERFHGKGLKVCVPLRSSTWKSARKTVGTLALVNVTEEEAGRREMLVNLAAGESDNETISDTNAKGGGERGRVGMVGSIVVAVGGLFAAGLL